MIATQFHITHIGEYFSFGGAVCLFRRDVSGRVVVVILVLKVMLDGTSHNLNDSVVGDINNMVEQVNEFGDVLCDCKKGCLRVLAGGAATLRSLCWR
ncbi:hypothetical protein FJT64_008183 [Amphibalanus amphitrite]|uniref:Uncharacterized protein n=1 Tax=Amphibalanus amphitrite TaxID=1232801 RepID=A0A6A4VMD1_AMPAM|nr:hypothetical protein FJT64_008183 [Amphibalanus amphitrite]